MALAEGLIDQLPELKEEKVQQKISTTDPDGRLLGRKGKPNGFNTQVVCGDRGYDSTETHSAMFALGIQNHHPPHTKPPPIV